MSTTSAAASQAETVLGAIGAGFAIVFGALGWMIQRMRTTTVDPTRTVDLADLREDVRYLVDAQRDFERKGWDYLPDDIATAPKLALRFQELDGRIDTVERVGAEAIASLGLAREDIIALRRLLEEHDEWERRQKHR